MQQGIKALIETCKEFGPSYEQTMDKVASKCTLSAEEAAEYMKMYW